MSEIIINNDAIRIRPSAIEGFYGCAYQWGKTFLEGIPSIPNSRASIGTAIHAGVETMWNEAMLAGTKNPNLTTMKDAAVEAFDEELQKGLQFDDGEDVNTCHKEVTAGMEAFVEDVVPFTRIPKAVEKFYKVDIDHPIVSEIGGTVDYITDTTIADVKTTKRKRSASGYSVQQSTYKYLANANGENIEKNLIQLVVLKKVPEGSILQLEPNEAQAKYLINGMLDTLELVAKDETQIDKILRPNPKHMFCSPKYCAHYNVCPAMKGEEIKQPVTRPRL